MQHDPLTDQVLLSMDTADVKAMLVLCVAGVDPYPDVPTFTNEVVTDLIKSIDTYFMCVDDEDIPLYWYDMTWIENAHALRDFDRELSRWETIRLMHREKIVAAKRVMGAIFPLTALRRLRAGLGRKRL